MVLSAPAAAPSPPQGVERWIDEIRAGLRLSPSGVLILVDQAVPEQLGRFVRAVLADHPEMDVLTSVGQLEALADGSVVVLVPEPSAAGWLNAHRPLFFRKALKVVLWCDAETSSALAREAPDFFDWIAQRQECPPGVAEHAVWTFRKALCARAPGIVFAGERMDQSSVEKVFQAAFPGRRLRWLWPEEIFYSEMVELIRGSKREWVACQAWTYGVAERFRWALAEARRRTRAVLVVPQGGEDWFWQVTDQIIQLKEATKLLSNAGAAHPGRLAATASLEWGAIAELIQLLAAGYDEDLLLRVMLRSPDAAAGLGETILASGIGGFGGQGWTMPGPVQRSLGRHTGLRRRDGARRPRRVEGIAFYDGPGFPLLRPKANAIERLLRLAPRTPETWQEVARLALDLGYHDVAATWADRALETRETPEALRIFGLAKAELGLFNVEAGFEAGSTFLVEALGALGRAVEASGPLPPEEALSVHALRAYLFLVFGLVAESEEPLAAALRAAGAPKARERDLLYLARALMRSGRHAEAEGILQRIAGHEEKREARGLLGECALARGRLDEAEKIAVSLADDPDLSENALEKGSRVAAERLLLDVLLARGDSGRALAVADRALLRASSRGHQISEPVLWRMPLMTRVLLRAGRLKDAEALFRKILGLGVVETEETIGAGLASQSVLRAFLAEPLAPPQMAWQLRASLLGGLVESLRSQGRHAEADQLESGLKAD